MFITFLQRLPIPRKSNTFLRYMRKLFAMTNHDTNGSSLASGGRPKLRAASTAVVSMLMAAALFGGV